MSKPIKILIADDHEIVLDGLKAILNPFSSINQEVESIHGSGKYPFQLIGIAEHGEGILNRLNHLPEVDIVVLDYYMSGMNGLDTAVEIKARFPMVKVILFSMEESSVIITEAYAQNIDAYVTKKEGRQRLLDTVKRVYSGERVFPILHHAREPYLPWASGKTQGLATGILSKREKEVACLIVNGRTTQQIADTLGIAFNTVEVHRNNIYRKLEIKRIAELVKYALDNNFCGE